MLLSAPFYPLNVHHSQEGELEVVVPKKPLHTESLLAGKKGPFVVVKQYRNGLDKYDDVQSTSSPQCQYAWYFDIPGKCEGFLTWNLESIGHRGVDI